MILYYDHDFICSIEFVNRYAHQPNITQQILNMYLEDIVDKKSTWSLVILMDATSIISISINIQEKSSGLLICSAQ